MKPKKKQNKIRNTNNIIKLLNVKTVQQQINDKDKHINNIYTLNTITQIQNNIKIRQQQKQIKYVTIQQNLHTYNNSETTNKNLSKNKKNLNSRDQFIYSKQNQNNQFSQFQENEQLLQIKHNSKRNSFNRNISNVNNINQHLNNLLFNAEKSTKSYIERMQQNNLSPFSNDGRSSSPRNVNLVKKTPQKLLKINIDLKDKRQIKLMSSQKQKETKKINKKAAIMSARQKSENHIIQKSKKITTNPNTPRMSLSNNAEKQKQRQSLTHRKPKNINLNKKKSNNNKNHQSSERNIQKQQKAHIQFQNQFLNMMNKKIHDQKITQKSSDQQIDGLSRKKVFITGKNNAKNKKKSNLAQLNIKILQGQNKNKKQNNYVKVNDDRTMLLVSYNTTISHNNTSLMNENYNCQTYQNQRNSYKRSRTKSFNLNYKSTNSSNQEQIVKTMRLKVMKNIYRQYPNLSIQQKKIICAVIIIQRLWRQKKVKKFFQHYVTPKSSLQSSLRESFNQKDSRLKNNKTLNILINNKTLGIYQEDIKSQKLRKKSQQFISQSSKMPLLKKQKQKKQQKNKSKLEDDFLIRQISNKQLNYLNKSEKFNKSLLQRQEKLKRIQKSSNQQNQKLAINKTKIIQKLNQNSLFNQQPQLVNNLSRPSLLKFLQCYRQIKLSKNRSNHKKSKLSSPIRNNVFNFRQSLSQKCLMQKYYNNVFSDRPQKDKPKNYQLFSSNNNGLKLTTVLKQNQKSIQLFKEINKQKNQQFKKQNNQQQQQEITTNNLSQKKHYQGKTPNTNLLNKLHQQVWVPHDRLQIQQQNQQESQEYDSDQLIKKNRKIIIIDQAYNYSPFNKIKNIESPIKNDQQLNEKNQMFSIMQFDSLNIQTKSIEWIQKEQQNNKISLNQQNIIYNLKNNQIDEQPILTPIKKNNNNQINENQIINVCCLLPQPRNLFPPPLLIPTSLSKFQPSIKQIQKVTQILIEQLMNQFSVQFKQFTQKKCLIKKRKQKKDQKQKQKKPKLPGIQINKETIQDYLTILIEYILQNNKQNILKSLNIFNSKLYLKCHRVQGQLYQIFDYQNQDQDQDQNEQQQDEYYWNVVSNDAYFKCQETYQNKNMKITLQNQKYKNFIELTMKIHNRSLTDSFSQILNKIVLDLIVHPWEKFNKTIKVQKKFVFISQNEKIKPNQFQLINLNNLSQKVKEKILNYCTLKVGSSSLRQKKRNQFQHEEQQEKKLLKMIHQQYVEQGREWQKTYDETYELKNQISQKIFQKLLKQIEEQIQSLNQRQIINLTSITKSQNQVFLETNQTLQTHNT